MTTSTPADQTDAADTGDEAVHWDWGDGNVEDGGTSETHTYQAAGAYRIHATGKGFDATVSVPVAGPDDAQPVLTLPDVTAKVGETVTYETSIHNETGESLKCRGWILVMPTTGTVDPAALSIIHKDFDAQHPELETTFRTDASTSGVIGEYGLPDGFPIVNPLDGSTQNTLTYTGTPFEALCRTEIRLQTGGALLCHAEWNLSVTAT